MNPFCPPDDKPRTCAVFYSTSRRGEMHQLFGDGMNTLINELNELLVA